MVNIIKQSSNKINIEHDNSAMYKVYLLTDVLTYLLIPWSRVLLGKLTGFQLVKKFSAFCGNQMFITAFTNARHMSVSMYKVYVHINLKYV
jgi:hypothetical protein